MQKWRDTGNYMGSDMSEYYILISKTRDSGILQNSNFDAAARLMDIDEEETETVQIHRFNHWTCGSIHALMIHESDEEAVLKGDDIQAQLEDYPLLDDEDFYQREHDYAIDHWQSLDISERVEFCQEHNESIFAARHEDPPVDCLEYLAIDA